MSQKHFTPALFRFLKDLAENNTREWFAENKHRYEQDIVEPAQRFIVDFGPHLQRISPHFRADPRRSGGSLFRIHRDVRFSKDKSPYKVHAGLHFRHDAGKSAHTPGFYLHLQPGESFIGFGIWRPDNPTLKMFRDAVVADPAAWKKAVGAKSFRENFQIAGESLKRPPKGYDPEHPLIEVLKLKDVTAFAKLTQKQVTSAGFLEEFAAACRAGGPFVKFISRAIGQAY